jgi:hypothetical protein
MSLSQRARAGGPAASVGVLAVSGRPYLDRCLDALRAQRDAPPFETVVVCDPSIGTLDGLADRHPEARIVVNAGQRTPLELASRALRECRGSTILLTKDHCVPAADWIHTMLGAQRDDRAAVGGRVEIASDASAVDWAFHFVDFSPYAGRGTAGPAASLTICNIAYRRADLAAVAASWAGGFVETRVHAALCSRFGALWFHPGSEVVLARPVSLRHALAERYVLGRLFGASRAQGWSRRRRLLYAGLAPALPVLLLSRMARVALPSRPHRRRFLRAVAPLILVVLARSLGEWVAYLTGRPPSRWSPRPDGPMPGEPAASPPALVHGHGHPADEARP